MHKLTRQKTAGLKTLKQVLRFENKKVKYYLARDTMQNYFRQTTSSAWIKRSEDKEAIGNQRGKCQHVKFVCEGSRRNQSTEKQTNKQKIQEKNDTEQQLGNCKIRRKG